MEPKMTLEQLTEYFKHQLTETETYTPPETMEYQTIDSSNGVKVAGFVKKEHLPGLLDMLNTAGFQHEGYRDRAPYFVKPDPNPV